MERRELQSEKALTPISFNCDMGRNITSESKPRLPKHPSRSDSMHEGIETDGSHRSAKSFASIVVTSDMDGTEEAIDGTEEAMITEMRIRCCDLQLEYGSKTIDFKPRSISY
jgi:hypothetical protein